MENKFNSEDEIRELVRSFEDATVSRADWRHAEHLTVALYYLTRHDVETATAKMRDGIFGLLSAFKVDTAKEMPYHETLTVFWMLTIAEFNASKNSTSLLEKANELVAKYDKDHPLKYYSRDFLFSETARAKYVEPDIGPFASSPPR